MSCREMVRKRKGDYIIIDLIIWVPIQKIRSLVKQIWKRYFDNIKNEIWKERCKEVIEVEKK